MLVKLEREARVLLDAGSVVDVSTAEAKRLLAIGFAVEVKQNVNKKTDRRSDNKRNRTSKN